MIRTRVARFLADEAGAIALDWVALTAATIVVGLLGVNIIGQSAVDVATEIEAAVRNAQLGDVVFVPTPSESSIAPSSSAPNGQVAP